MSWEQAPCPRCDDPGESESDGVWCGNSHCKAYTSTVPYQHPAACECHNDSCVALRAEAEEEEEKPEPELCSSFQNGPRGTGLEFLCLLPAEHEGDHVAPHEGDRVRVRDDLEVRDDGEGRLVIAYSNPFGGAGIPLTHLEAEALRRALHGRIHKDDTFE